MRDSTKSARATNRANVPAKNKKSPIVPGKLLPNSRVLWRSVRTLDFLLVDTLASLKDFG